MSCFAAAGPKLWYSLPVIWDKLTLATNIKRLLKTFLFGAWGRNALWLTVKLHLSKWPYLLITTADQARAHWRLTRTIDQVRQADIIKQRSPAIKSLFNMPKKIICSRRTDHFYSYLGVKCLKQRLYWRLSEAIRHAYNSGWIFIWVVIEGADWTRWLMALTLVDSWLSDFYMILDDSYVYI